MKTKQSQGNVNNVFSSIGGEGFKKLDQDLHKKYRMETPSIVCRAEYNSRNGMKTVTLIVNPVVDNYRDNATKEIIGRLLAAQDFLRVLGETPANISALPEDIRYALGRKGRKPYIPENVTLDLEAIKANEAAYIRYLMSAPMLSKTYYKVISAVWPAPAEPYKFTINAEGGVDVTDQTDARNWQHFCQHVIRQHLNTTKSSVERLRKIAGDLIVEQNGDTLTITKELNERYHNWQPQPRAGKQPIDVEALRTIELRFTENPRGGINVHSTLCIPSMLAWDAKQGKVVKVREFRKTEHPDFNFISFPAVMWDLPSDRISQVCQDIFFICGQGAIPEVHGMSADLVMDVIDTFSSIKIEDHIRNGQKVKAYPAPDVVEKILVGLQQRMVARVNAKNLPEVVVAPDLWESLERVIEKVGDYHRVGRYSRLWWTDMLRSLNEFPPIGGYKGESKEEADARKKAEAAAKADEENMLISKSELAKSFFTAWPLLLAITNRLELPGLHGQDQPWLQLAKGQWPNRVVRHDDRVEALYELELKASMVSRPKYPATPVVVVEPEPEQESVEPIHVNLSEVVGQFSQLMETGEVTIDDVPTEEPQETLEDFVEELISFGANDTIEEEQTTEPQETVEEEVVETPIIDETGLEPFVAESELEVEEFVSEAEDPYEYISELSDEELNELKDATLIAYMAKNDDESFKSLRAMTVEMARRKFGQTKEA